MSTVEVMESMGDNMWDVQRAHDAAPSAPSLRPAFGGGVDGDGRRHPLSPRRGQGAGDDGDAARVGAAGAGGEAAKRSPMGGAERKAVVVRRQSVSKVRISRGLGVWPAQLGLSWRWVLLESQSLTADSVVVAGDAWIGSVPGTLVAGSE